MDFTVERLSEDALLLRFGERIDPVVNARVHAAARSLRKASLSGITDIAPAYASLLLRFGSESGSGSLSLLSTLRSIIEAESEPDPVSLGRSTIVVPVCYGGEFGADLDTLATHAGLSREEVVARHVAGEYTVAMLGFAPGFPYLLGLDPGLQAPRHASPRTRVPAGSVAIGGAQTGIYPRELPGGWNLIGTTPLTLFDPGHNPPALLAPGDRVRFRAIHGDEFAALRARHAHTSTTGHAPEQGQPSA